MSNVKLHHPDNPDFVIQRDEDEAPSYKANGWTETSKAVTKADED